MSILDTIRWMFLGTPPPGVQQRDFVTGADVSSWDTYFGRDTEDYTPAEYGEYIATSNAVYACATLRAELLASIPLKLYKLRAGGTQDEVTRGAMYDLLRKVNPFWTWTRLIKMTELSRCLWGVSYWFLERGTSGRGPVKEIWWARPDRVKVHPHQTDYVDHFSYQPSTGAQVLSFAPSESVWMPMPNPVDEFAGLSPLAAARLAADFASAGMKANRYLFSHGLKMGGVVMPVEGVTWTKEQADDVSLDLEKRFKGVDKAHRWAVFRQQIEMREPVMTPKDAEFLGGLAWALEDVARAYKVPLDLVGGQRTYENVNAAMEAIWTHCIIPEASEIQDHMNEQLVPIFPEVDMVEFDFSKVPVLQEDRTEITTQMQQLWNMGVPLNKVLEEYQPTLLPKDGGYSWGDVWWAPMTLLPAGVSSSEPETPAPEAQDEEPRGRAYHKRVAYGSEEHKRIWKRFIRRTDAYERRVARAVTELFNRQMDSLKDKLLSLKRSEGEPETRGLKEVILAIFQMASWVKTFRDAIEPVLTSVVDDVGNAALEDLGLSLAFNVADPAVTRFLHNRAQRFAEKVNETTWDLLKASLIQGIDGGEGIPELADRVEQVMRDRIRSSKETIARTEVIGASNGGMLEGWKQSDVVRGKQWIAALDDRTRDSHVMAHGQTVALTADFEVGGERGPAPGQIGVAEEDINCRCTMLAVLDIAAGGWL